MKKIVIFIFLILLSRNAFTQDVASPDNDRLSVGNIKWKLGHSSYSKGSVLLQFILEDQTAQKWTSLLQYSTSPITTSDFTINTYMNAFVRDLSQSCPNLSWNTLEKNDYSSIFETSTKDCKALPTVNSIVRILIDNKNAYFVSYSVKPILDEDEKSRWTTIEKTFFADYHDQLDIYVNKAINASKEAMTAEMQSALTFIKNKDYLDAIPVLNGVIEKKPKIMMAYVLRSICLKASKDYEGAIKDLLKARELSPSFAKVDSFLGDLYLIQGKPAQADAYLALYLQTYPYDGTAYYMRAQANYRMKNFEDSLKYLSKAETLGFKDIYSIRQKIYNTPTDTKSP